MTGSHFRLPVILHYLPITAYQLLITDYYQGVVVGAMGVTGASGDVGNGKMNWLPLGINIVWTPGDSFKMYWYCKISGFC